MVEQRVQHMQRLACGSRDQLAVEGAVAVREMRVDLEPGLLAIVSIEVAGVTTEACGLEELTV